MVIQEIVGVVRDAKYRNLRDDAPPTVYVPLRGRRGATVQLRTEMPLEAAASMLRDEAARSTPVLAVTEISLQSALVESGRLRERLLALLSGFFGLVSLALAAIGVYGSSATPWCSAPARSASAWHWAPAATPSCDTSCATLPSMPSSGSPAAWRRTVRRPVREGVAL